MAILARHTSVRYNIYDNYEYRYIEKIKYVPVLFVDPEKILTYFVEKLNSLLKLKTKKLELTI